MATVRSNLPDAAAEAAASVEVSPRGSLTACGLVAEEIYRWAGRRRGQGQRRGQPFSEYLKEINESDVFPSETLRSLNDIRKLVNEAKHRVTSKRTSAEAQKAVQLLAQVISWARAEANIAPAAERRATPSTPSPVSPLPALGQAGKIGSSTSAPPADLPSSLTIRKSAKVEGGGTVWIVASLILAVFTVAFLLIPRTTPQPEYATALVEAPEVVEPSPSVTRFTAPKTFYRAGSAPIYTRPDRSAQTTGTYADGEVTTAEGYLVGDDGDTYLAVRSSQGGGYVRLAEISHPTSFDCTKVRQATEVDVCVNGPLASLDRHMSDIYQASYRSLDGDGQAGLQTSQRAWLASRDQCDSTDCITQKYHERIEALFLAAPSAPTPIGDVAAGPALIDSEEPVPAAPAADVAPKVTIRQAAAAATVPRLSGMPDEHARLGYYPDVAVRGGVSGEAMLECRVLRIGIVDTCKVKGEEPRGYGFGRAALALSTFLTFEPAARAGRPVPGKVTISVAFERLSRPDL